MPIVRTFKTAKVFLSRLGTMCYGLAHPENTHSLFSELQVLGSILQAST